ncbi:protein eva-1 homolog A-like [Oncorhynchus keta]|uniref:protein eva-1 homolog A-like n=1 Tax=Oncorhynchus keta TaxID=8018 RepID=UPI00227AE88E|nr:protein eva-1 homolog A-like [Oncorhynchus keta]
MAGCTISPLAFTMAMQVIIRASRWVVGVSEKPVKSLGRWYNESLRDKDQVQQVRQDIADGLENINKILLPDKLKLWCLQFGLLPRLSHSPLLSHSLSLSLSLSLSRSLTHSLSLALPFSLTFSLSPSLSPSADHPERAALYFLCGVCLGLFFTLFALVVQISCRTDCQPRRRPGTTTKKRPRPSDSSSDSRDSDSDTTSDLSARRHRRFERTLNMNVFTSAEELERAQRLEERERIIREIWMNGQPDIPGTRSLNRYY